MRLKGRTPNSNEYYINKVKDKLGDKYFPLKIKRKRLKREKRPTVLLECRMCHYQYWKDITTLFDTRYKGCPRCGKRRHFEKMKEKYLYRKNRNPLLHLPMQEYNSTNIKVFCEKHGVFYASMSNLMHSKYGCKRCAEEKQGKALILTLECAKRKIEQKSNGNFKLISEEFYGVYDTYTFQHVGNCGHTFTAKYHTFENNLSCPFCRVTSAAERVMNVILTNNNIKYQYQWRFPAKDHTHYFDFYLDDYNVLIELQGRQHIPGSKAFRDTEYCRKRYAWDKDKRRIAESLKIKLIYIQYTDFDPRDMIRILNQNGIQCSYDENEDYHRLLHTKKEIAKYAWEHGNKAAVEKYSLSSATVTTYCKLLYGKTLHDKVQDELREQYIAITEFCKGHTVHQTMARFGVAQTTVQKAFKETTGMTKSEYRRKFKSAS